jgi:beta-xylosidase
VFSYFKGNGADGLHLAYSRDGLQWTALNGDKPVLRPVVGSRLMRDPCVYLGPDKMFHAVWTTGWWDKGIGIAHSRDLINWSEQKSLPVMEREPTALNCWAPEIFFDDVSSQYMIFWSTTLPGRFAETEPTGDDGNGRKLNHRIYCVTTRDFRSYSDTRLLYDGGFNVIDATIVKVARKYAMVVKDETRYPTPKKNLRIALSGRAQGPYGQASPPISVDWVEGPSILRVDDSWVVYYDEYTRRRYGAIRTNDFKKWKVISESIRFPEGARHGTALRVPEPILAELLRLK